MGSNEMAQLGTGDQRSRTGVVEVTALANMLIVAIEAHNNFSAAITGATECLFTLKDAD